MTTMERNRNIRENNLDMITGCYNRLHVSYDPEERAKLLDAVPYYCKQIIAAQTAFADELKEKGMTMKNRPCQDFTDLQSVMRAIRATYDEDTIGYLCGCLESICEEIYRTKNQVTDCMEGFDD